MTARNTVAFMHYSMHQDSPRKVHASAKHGGAIRAVCAPVRIPDFQQQCGTWTPCMPFVSSISLERIVREHPRTRTRIVHLCVFSRHARRTYAHTTRTTQMRVRAFKNESINFALYFRPSIDHRCHRTRRGRAFSLSLSLPLVFVRRFTFVVPKDFITFACSDASLPRGCPIPRAHLHNTHATLS